MRWVSSWPGRLPSAPLSGGPGLQAAHRRTARGPESGAKSERKRIGEGAGVKPEGKESGAA